MRKRLSDRWWIGILLSMLLVEMVLLGVHFLWNGFSPQNTKAPTAPMAGSVLTNKNELHRRSLNSLIWEKSNTNDTLYFYDSILTLAQSSASLKLFKDTQIQLSENTLLTIEPANDKEYGEITLKVHKGGLRARNPNAPAQIEAETWTMAIRTGSEIDLRQTNDSEYELSVKNGEVKFDNQNNSTVIKSQQVLRVNKEKIETLAVDAKQELQWLERPPSRIYSHPPQTEITLQWKDANAEQLVIQSLGKPERIIALEPHETTKSISLPYGQHRFYLRKPNLTSEALEVEVMTAPIVHLLNPLPRDRGKINEPIEFKWIPTVAAKTYEVQFLNEDQLNVQTTDLTHLKKDFSSEANLEWSVWGIDPEGYKIPPPYKYPLYIREEPLAAPKLRAPTLRAPAQEKPKEKTGASFWWQFKNLVLPEAMAEDLTSEATTYFQVELNWEKVTAADHYLVEISESADFRSPIVTQKVMKPQFVWSRVEKKEYYWRVAAGSKSGRLGIFSEPKKMDLSNSVPVTPPSPASAVQNSVKPTSTPAKTPLPAAPKSEPPAPPAAYRSSEQLAFEWRPFAHYLEAKSEQSVSSKLSGINLISIGATTEQKYYDTHLVKIEFQLSRISLNPNPKDKYPFQKNIDWSEYAASAMVHKTASPVGFGGTLRHTIELERSGLESVAAKDLYLLGPGFEYNYQSGNHEFLSTAYVLLGSQNGLQLGERWRLKAGPNRILGFGFDFTALFKGSQSSFGARLNAAIGFGF